MAGPPRNWRRFLGQLILTVAGAVAAFVFLYDHRPQGTLWIDFAEYWAAGRLFLEGRNPYDSRLVAEIQKALTDAPETVLMWNPPVIFPFIVIFGAMSFPFARALWLICSMLLMAGVALRAIVSGVSGRGLFWGGRSRAVIYAITFPGFFYSLAYAQVSPLLLLGLWVYMQIARKQDRSSAMDVFSGAALSLTLVKPQLLYLLYVFLLFGIRERRNFFVLCGLTAGGLILLALAALVSPEVLLQYFEAMRNPPLYWQTPSLGSWVQGVTGINSGLIRSLPAMLSVLLLLLVMLWRRVKWNEGNTWLIVCLSLLFSPYAWTYDLVLIFPAMIWAIGRAQSLSGHFRRPALLVWAAIATNLLSFVTPGAGMQYLVWYPAASLLLVWAARRLTYSSGLTGKI